MNRNEHVEDVLHRTLEETHDIIEQMRKSVTSELITSEYEYIVCTSICQKEMIHLLPGEMTCVLPDDVKKFHVNLSAVQDATEKGVAIVVDELFLKKDISYEEESGNWIQGQLISNYRVFPVCFQLRRKMEYLNQVEELSQWFRKNGVPFQPLYIPYLYKFFYVVLEPVTIEWKENEVLEALEIDYGELEGHYKKDVVPVWNVVQEIVHRRGNRILTGNTICFQYELQCKETASGMLVAVDEEKLKHIGFSRNGDVLLESYEEQDDWIVLYFNKIETEFGWEEPVLSNGVKDTFANRFAGYFGTPVLSSGELTRKIESYADAASVSYVKFEVAEDGTYDTDELSEPEKLGLEDRRPLLILHFRRNEKLGWLARETMNFLVAVIQKEFSSYHVVGKLTDL